ncbi:MAG: hypothetical protein LBN95_13040 [Prevotellaceae bacterium]|jgi:hypothetical protein|nr:hypothetical protein [Prevotellaceae bacterium]
MNKIYKILLFALIVCNTALAQVKDCLGNDFIIAPNNSTVSVGDIYIKNGKTYTLSFSRDKLLKRSGNGDIDLLALKEDSINNCSVDVTKNFKAGFDIEMPFKDSIFFNITTNHALIKSAKMEVKDGKKISLKNGTSDINDILNLLDLAALESMLKDIKKGRKAVLIVETIHIKDGSTNIEWTKTPSFNISAKIDTVKGNITYSQTNGKNLKIAFKSNITVGYKTWNITKKEIELIICEKKTAIGKECSSAFNFNSLVPSWAQFQRGDKVKGHLFLWSEVVFIPTAAVAWCQYSKYNRLSKEPSRNKSTYETNKNIYLGVGIGSTVFAAGFYLWNIIDGNTNKSKNLSFMPYFLPNESGIYLSLKF